MSGAPRVRSMNVTESESRSILGFTGNKSLGPVPTRKPVSKTSKKTEMSPEEGSIGARNRGIASSSPPFSSTGVPSILRRQVSLNASCSSDASTDSFQSRASTGRIYRTRGNNVRGRRQLASKPKTVVADSASQTSPDQDSHSKKRCSWVTSSSDQPYTIFHDEEWGVPVHDDKKLFELLVLCGALSELTWPAILNKRHLFREVFADFDPAVVGKLNEKKLVGPANVASSLLSELKLRAILENARQISKVIDEFGSFDKYIWSFVNYKPIISRFRYPRQIPVKTPKADVISKDLIRRGFRSVGPTVIYSFMQVAGITNDHLCSCFRFQECLEKVGIGLIKVEEDDRKTEDGMESCVRNEIEDLSFSSG
ncbi:hypothetical protein LXL04_028216 [Taraxacum kok-saghyz]